MKIWCTGEAGMMAKNLVDHCNVESDFDIVNRLSEDYYNYWRMAITSSEKEVNIFDPSLPKLIQDSGAEAIVHTASIDYDTTIKNTSLAVHTNIEGTYTIASIAKRLDIPIIYLSALGGSANAYTTIKTCGEQMIQIVGQRSAIIRPTHIYGKYDTKSYIAKMLLSCRGKQQTLPSDISNNRDFIHTSELTSIIFSILKKNLYGDVFEAGSALVSLEEIFAHLTDDYNLNIDCIFDGNDFMGYVCADAKTISGLIEKRVVMKDAVPDMIKDFEL